VGERDDVAGVEQDVDARRVDRGRRRGPGVRVVELERVRGGEGLGPPFGAGRQVEARDVVAFLLRALGAQGVETILPDDGAGLADARQLDAPGDVFLVGPCQG